MANLAAKKAAEGITEAPAEEDKVPGKRGPKPKAKAEVPATDKPKRQGPGPEVLEKARAVRMANLAAKKAAEGKTEAPAAEVKTPGKRGPKPKA